MKKSRIVFPVLLMLVAMHVQASNIPPVAVLTSTPNQIWFHNLEYVVISSSSSYDTDGSVNQTAYYIDGVFQTLSTPGGHTQCFALYGSPAGDCYELDQGATTVTVGLEVRDNEGAWSSRVTKTYTIREHKGRKYFLTDHIGNVRATVNRDGNVLGYDDYYPFGKVMPDRSNNTANPNDNYKFTGYEQDDEAGVDLYYAGARGYDPVLGRFMQIDRFYDKYPSMSPYQYAANNPLYFVDVNGDSINVKTLQNVDAAKSTNTTQQVINDLQSMTGLSLSIDSNGMVTYAKDADGNAIIAKDKDGNVIGSATARTDLIGALDNTTTVDVGVSNNGSKAGGNIILIDAGQINDFISGTSSDLDNRTLGFGMTFLHELNHTSIGGSLKDDRSAFGNTGAVVNKMNTIRSELGSSFGQRTSYMGLTFSTTKSPVFIPFSMASKNMLNQGKIPKTGFIKYWKNEN